MAFEEIANTVHEPEDGPPVIYCVVCGDPENSTGGGPPDQVMIAGWKRVGDSLVCGNPHCQAEAADLSDEELSQLLDDGVQNETLTPEQVAELSNPGAGAEFDLSALPEVKEGV